AVGDRLEHRRAPEARLGAVAEADHVPDLAHGRVGALPVGLVDHEHVTDLEDARLGGLDPVTHAGGQQHYRRVGQSGDLHLTLPDADGLHDDDVAARGVQHPQRLRRAPRQPAQVAAAGHGPDVDLRVQGVVAHPDAVPQQCAAGERRGRVHCKHPDPQTPPAQPADQHVGAGGLADAGAPGEADDVGVAGVRGQRGHHLPQRRVVVLDEGDRPRNGTRRTRPGPLDQGGDVYLATPHPGGAQACAGTRTIRASPCPPPPHRAAAPVPPPRRLSSRARVRARRAPDIPIGWPSAMAPPLGLTRSGSRPSSLVDARPTAANASLISTTSRSVGSMPSFLQAAAIARDGWLCRVESGPATTPCAPISASQVRPSSSALVLLITTTAAAPSEIWEALPAVMVPSLEKAGRSLPSDSTVVSGRMPSSSRKSMGSPLRCGTWTVTTSSSNLPSSHALAASWWLRAE